MEHRYFPRVEIPLAAKLYRNETLLGTFMTRNISLEGMFLETGDIALVRNDIIRLQLAILQEEYLIKGIVAHIGYGGIGILMIDATFFNLIKAQRPSITNLLSKMRCKGLGQKLDRML
jgi:hypothetical protein